jgi:trigger factor
LNSTLEKLDGNRVRLTVSHTADEVGEAIANSYTAIARRIKLPGFRPGKAPRPIIDAQVGRDSVLADALENLIERSYPRALDEHDLRPIERPDTGELDLLTEGEDYTYTAEVDVRPELTLSSIEDLKVSVPPQGTSDAEIDQQLDYLRDRMATLEVVEGRGVAEGDFALLTFVGTVEGKTAEDLSVDKYLYEFGRGIMPEGFEEGMLGAMPGETRTVTLTVPDNAANPDYAGKEAVFEVTAHEIKAKTLPAVDEEFAASNGFDSVEEMREDMRRRLEGNKAAGRIRTIEREARAALADRLVGDVPQALIDDRKEELLEQFLESIGKQGYSREDYLEAAGMTEEELDLDMTNEAAANLRENFALEALFRQAGLGYTEEELEGEIAGIAAAEKVQPDAMRARLLDSGAMSLVRERLARRAALTYLIENTEVLEAEPADVIAKLAAEHAEQLAEAKKAEAKPKRKPAAKKSAKADEEASKEE